MSISWFKVQENLKPQRACLFASLERIRTLNFCRKLLKQAHKFAFLELTINQFIMYNFKALQKKVEEKINNLNLSNEPFGLYQPIRYSLDSGGKRLRPVLTLMSANMFTDNIDMALNPALALEIFHNFTLLHDDLMDKADIRRNQATVHKKWSANTAILSGDAMMIKAFQLICRSEYPNKDEIIELFNQTALEVCEGQQYDMNFETRLDVAENEYIRMIKLKTSVLIAACLKIGALCANSDSKNAQYLYDFGINMGLSFQLQDDYLDTFGDVKTFGKKIGGDIIANKKTFLLIKALELAKGKQAEELKQLITQNNFEDNYKIEKVTHIYKELMIDELVKTKIKDYNLLAINELNSLDIDNDKKTILYNLANKLINRSN